MTGIASQTDDRAPGFLALVESNEVAQVRRLLETDDNCEADQKPSQWSPESALRAIHTASFHGFAELAKVLLEHGADIDRKADGKYTPLHYAVFFKHYETVEVLMSFGADPLIPDDEGRTAIGRASDTKDEKMLHLLSEPVPQEKEKEDL